MICVSNLWYLHHRYPAVIFRLNKENGATGCEILRDERMLGPGSYVVLDNSKCGQGHIYDIDDQPVTIDVTTEDATRRIYLEVCFNGM